MNSAQKNSPDQLLSTGSPLSKKGPIDKPCQLIRLAPQPPQICPKNNLHSLCRAQGRSKAATNSFTRHVKLIKGRHLAAAVRSDLCKKRLKVAALVICQTLPRHGWCVSGDPN